MSGRKSAIQILVSVDIRGEFVLRDSEQTYLIRQLLCTRMPKLKKIRGGPVKGFHSMPEWQQLRRCGFTDACALVDRVSMAFVIEIRLRF